MFQKSRSLLSVLAVCGAVGLCLSGCTSFKEYKANGYKVGPNYAPPPAPVATHWIEASDARVREQSEDLSQWWTVFNDPVLDRLVADAYGQNLTLREAGFRVLQARAQLDFATGSLFPQTQNATGGYRRNAATGNFFDQWNFGFNLAWELDFWGRFRRAVTAAEDQLDASVADYDAVLVTLLGDVATNYVQIRTDQARIKLLQDNVAVQKQVLDYVRAKAKEGKANALDVRQAEVNWAETRAQIPPLIIDLFQANNRLCTLLGKPPADLQEILGGGPDSESPIDCIPKAPREDVAVGIPAELLRRRPDVRRAERTAAAQAELIGIAEAQFYPAISLTGTLGYQAANFADLFKSSALTGGVGPSFQWNLLNYGRILSNVRFQDAKFQELAVTYQNTVLQAAEEVEDGLVTFLQAQDRLQRLDDSVAAATAARDLAIKLYKEGAVGVPGVPAPSDFNRFSVLELTRIQQDDLRAQARGQIALGLIQVYRALGGGWQIRCDPSLVAAPMPASVLPALPEGDEEIPAPSAKAPNKKPIRTKDVKKTPERAKGIESIPPGTTDAAKSPGRAKAKVIEKSPAPPQDRDTLMEPPLADDPEEPLKAPQPDADLLPAKKASLPKE
jgi:NodT family efflux transporter outer membrane factor (OMF) lipoprotein